MLEAWECGGGMEKAMSFLEWGRRCNFLEWEKIWDFWNGKENVISGMEKEMDFWSGKGNALLEWERKCDFWNGKKEL